MAHTSAEYVELMAGAMQHAKDFVSGIGYDAFRADDKTLLATQQAVVMTGEAARRVPTEVRTRFTDIPWREFADMRDALISRYYAIDTFLLWETVTVVIPKAMHAVQRCLTVVADEESPG